MARVLETIKGKTLGQSAKILQPAQVKPALSALAWKILKSLAEKSSYPKSISKTLGENEQKVYYHIHRLQKAGLIKIERVEERGGGVAKIYSIAAPAFALLLKPLEHVSGESKEAPDLEPFVQNGKLNCKIIVASPEPHGYTGGRGKDAPIATEFGLFLGQFVRYFPARTVLFDAEAHENVLKQNIIVIAGPGVNSVTFKANKKLPIRFEGKGEFFTALYSTITGKKYVDESCGVALKIKNPFNPQAELILLAGRRAAGTRAAVVAFTKKLEVLSGGKKHWAHVVKGFDTDRDGFVDEVKVLE